MPDLERKKKIRFYLEIFLSIIGLLSLITFLLILGFKLNEYELYIIKILMVIIAFSFIIQEFARWFLAPKITTYLKRRWLENLLALILLADIISPYSVVHYLARLSPGLTIKQATLIYLGVIQAVILLAIIVKALRYNYLISRIKLAPGAIFAISFASIIIFGTILLLLPNATPEGKSLSFIDALFTSTSSVCVTGLIVVDTAKDFTLLGKTIILFLIQIGGLGVMTLTTFFAIFLSGGVSYRFRIVMKDLLSQENLSEITSLLIKILLFTVVIESIGALILYLSMGGSFIDFSWNYFGTSVFHSVSAFCNAGFSTYSSGLMDNQVASNYYFLTVIMILIVIGGLGFTVLSNFSTLDFSRKKKKRLKYQLSMSTKIVLSSTSILIFGGALAIYITEPFAFNSTLTTGQKLFHSLFLSITTRTAGFNTIPTEHIANVVVLITLPLMWIGASPGSTGGGVKTTTISITLLALFNLMRGKEKVEIFGREISFNSIRKAFMIILSSLILLCIATILLIWIEPDKKPLDLIFEAVSAISTVGLSRNITHYLGSGGKTVIILLMFIGRIGVLTFFLAFVKGAVQPRYSLPKTEIMVG